MGEVIAMSSAAAKKTTKKAAKKKATKKATKRPARRASKKKAPAKKKAKAGAKTKAAKQKAANNKKVKKQTPLQVANALRQALTKGHLEAARMIANAWISHERANEKLAAKRKEFNDSNAQAMAALRAAIERMGEARGENDVEFREAAVDVLMSFQTIQEVEHGRKTIIHELLSTKRDAKKKMDKAAKEWQQIDLPLN